MTPATYAIAAAWITTLAAAVLGMALGAHPVVPRGRALDLPRSS